VDAAAGRGIAEFRLEHHGRILTVNAERAANRWVRAEFVREWRQAFALLARQSKVPPLAWCDIAAHPSQARGRLQDTAACLPAVKAAVDGIVDAGIVPDDDGKHVRTITFHPARRGPDGLILTIVGPEA
jgi:hypothetical protein